MQEIGVEIKNVEISIVLLIVGWIVFIPRIREIIETSYGFILKFLKLIPNSA